MLAWIVDHSNVLYFLLGAAVLAFLAWGWTTRQVKYWGYAALAAGVFGLLWLLSLFVIPDRRQIERNLDAMAQAAVEQKPDALLKHISKDFRFGAMSGADLQKSIGNSIRAHKVGHVRLWAKQTTVSGDTGETIFNFRADADGGGTYAASAKGKFVREGGEWKLREIQVFKLGSTERQHIPGVD